MSNNHLAPDFVGPIEPMLRRELHLLELLFDDPGLTSLRERTSVHPAVKRYDKIKAFIRHGMRLRYPDETDLVLEVGSMLLDALALDPTVTAENVLEAIDDPEVLRQLRTRVSDPQQFTDQMVALSCWDLLRANGFTARLVERDGLPDILVSLMGNPNEWIEVKRIRMGSNPRRARNVIGDANAQIKRADPGGVGAVYLSIERPQQRVAFDDISPPEIQAFVDEVERELGSGHSRSVSLVIVAWDDYLLLGTPPERSNYYLRRRSVLLEHRAPRRTSNLSRQTLELGRTVALPIIWSGPSPNKMHLAPIQAGSITVTEQFRQECELTGDVRSVHAIEALQRPSAVANYQLGEETTLLVTRRVTLGSHPYTLLVIATARNTSQTEILLGFRIYDDDVALGEETHPFDVFTVLLERYGVPVEVGNHRELFIPRAIVELSLQGDSHIVRGQMPNDEPILVHALIKVRDTTPRMADVAWAFAILTGRYRRDIRRHEH